jgi:hypothetical protein
MKRAANQPNGGQVASYGSRTLNAENPYGH